MKLTKMQNEQKHLVSNQPQNPVNISLTEKHLKHL
jgi:hypothetical protein